MSRWRLRQIGTRRPKPLHDKRGTAATRAAHLSRGSRGRLARREREMIRLGLPVRLLSAAAWNEGGSLVALDTRTDQFVTGVRTFGRHPNLFVYDPIGLWRVLRAKGFDLIDVHEEPVSVAAAEVQVLAALAGQPRSVRALLGPEHCQAVPRPIPLARADRNPARERHPHLQRRCGPDPARQETFAVSSAISGSASTSTASGRHRPARTAAVCAPAMSGRLEPRKGVHVLVDAVARVDECTLEIVGEGSQRSAIEAQIAACGASDRITLDGLRFAGRASGAVPDLRPGRRTVARHTRVGRAVREGRARSDGVRCAGDRVAVRLAARVDRRCGPVGIAWRCGRVGSCVAPAGRRARRAATARCVRTSTRSALFLVRGCGTPRRAVPGGAPCWTLTW